MRILFTGGSGKAGRHVMACPAEQGRKATNVDLMPPVAEHGKFYSAAKARQFPGFRPRHGSRDIMAE